MSKTLDDGPPVEFIFDTHQKFKRIGQGPAYYEHSRQLDVLRELTADRVQYRNGVEFPLIQAADLLAWQVRRFLCATGEPRRKHYSDLRADREEYEFQELILPPEYLTNWIQTYNGFVLGILERLGCSMDDLINACIESTPQWTERLEAMMQSIAADTPPDKRAAVVESYANLLYSKLVKGGN
jgi:hypothetical protein